tara:strand:+ start:1111 stop:1725 length:615 start_codon:yes stop_codon:yes gene_type:complete
MKIYVSKNNQTSGPYSEEQIAQMIEDGSIAEHDLCSQDGADWQPLSDFIQTDEYTPSAPKKSIQSGSPKESKKSRASERLAKIKNQQAKFSKPIGAATSTNKTQDPPDCLFTVSKEAYLEQIRTKTLYPNFRLFLKILFFVNAILGFLMIIGGIYASIEIGVTQGTLTLLGGFLMIFFAFVGKESGGVVVDIADSVIENNSKEK